MYSINERSFCTNNMGNTSGGSLRIVPDREHSTFYNKDKIKINFNMEDDLKKELWVKKMMKTIMKMKSVQYFYIREVYTRYAQVVILIIYN